MLPLTVAAFFGVLHSDRVRSCLQQLSTSSHQRHQCLPRPFPGITPPPSYSQSLPLGTLPPGHRHGRPSLSRKQPVGCGDGASVPTPCHSSQSQRPACFLGPLCAGNRALAPWLLLSTQVHLPAP
ncbi:hypothetical protein H1C71_008655 [Ictidomys tridecemlineatus]|nr:hypothetical protein H1C71_008655 [Ictidomys tridecemlineatus]